MDQSNDKPSVDGPEIDPITGQPVAVKRTKNKHALIGAILFLASLAIFHRTLNARIERSSLTPLFWILWLGSFGGGLWFIWSAIRQDRADRAKQAGEKKKIPFNPR